MQPIEDPVAFAVYLEVDSNCTCTGYRLRLMAEHNQMQKIDKIRGGVLVGTGMGDLQVFSDGVQALIEKGHRKITPFFIPYAITNMASALGRTK
ncbi:hypothetical protein SASPL_103620 [Salvia splendens]|uniref:beta-ketoacyl-[acyl-carrier-protein] synthase I n=1 Tax=Salvia splendens TaxID=180675 RepID=A0A8X9A6Z2_SALSN|nr:3-oxoacyl-[acyl-carrier-protein] synthase I, chloroplastic-like [Salvia splendens]KAG6432047.1 hypothetical protein SASPL_103620 [Salvia splendens]